LQRYLDDFSMVFDTTALKSTKAMVACAAGYEVYTAAVQVAGGVGERQRCDSNQLLHHLQHVKKSSHTRQKQKKVAAAPPSI